MKLRTVLGLSVGGMLFSSLTVYALSGPPPAPSPVADTTPPVSLSADLAPPVPTPTDRFLAEGTLRVEARLGHATVARDGSRETFLLLETMGADVESAARAPVHMALVVDRSGSMQGERLVRAKEAARAMLERLADGDQVSVMTFDQTARLIVPATHLDASSRQRVGEAIDALTADGATCLSCGVEMAIEQLRASADTVDRMIVLSDGRTNQGLRQLDDFRSLGEQCRGSGVSITTIGLGLDYNEQLLTSVAFASSGRHHFVESPEALARVFDEEARALASTVAKDAEARVRLPAGVELVRVFDRSFRRDGDTVVVPLGAFSRRETKTVLMQVRLPAGATGGRQLVAGVDLRFADLAEGGEGSATGDLAVDVVEGSVAGQLDPFVALRVERSRSAEVRTRANELFRQGQFVQAEQLLRRRAVELQGSADEAVKAARSRGDARADDIQSEFDRQQSSTGAMLNAAEARPASPKAPAARRAIQQSARDAFDDML